MKIRKKMLWAGASLLVAGIVHFSSASVEPEVSGLVLANLEALAGDDPEAGVSQNKFRVILSKDHCSFWVGGVKYGGVYTMCLTGGSNACELFCAATDSGTGHA